MLMHLQQRPAASPAIPPPSTPRTQHHHLPPTACAPFLPGLQRYEADRGYADGRCVSRLSPFLHWGQLSPRLMQDRLARAGGKQVRCVMHKENAAWARQQCRVHAAVPNLNEKPPPRPTSTSQASKTFWRRLLWRDLAYWQLHHFPTMAARPIRPQYAAQVRPDVQVQVAIRMAGCAHARQLLRAGVHR